MSLFASSNATATPSGLVCERKLVGPGRLAPFALGALQSALLPDPKHPEGTLHSIYFDSPALDSFREKANGDNLKLKLRLRWYEPEAGEQMPSDGEIPCFLEMKARIGAARRKARVEVRAPATWLGQASLSDAALSRFLARHAAALPFAVPHNWIPSICVSYRRRRFVCPQTQARVSLDWDVCSMRANPVLFPAQGPMRLDCSLCEFKSPSGEAPPWLDVLFAIGYRLRSHSKYASLVELRRCGAPCPF